MISLLIAGPIGFSNFRKKSSQFGDLKLLLVNH